MNIEWNKFTDTDPKPSDWPIAAGYYDSPWANQAGPWVTQIFHHGMPQQSKFVYWRSLVVEPPAREQTQKEKDTAAYSQWVCSFTPPYGVNGAAAIWHAALAYRDNEVLRVLGPDYDEYLPNSTVGKIKQLCGGGA